MSRIVYATATSLDGYLADADNSLDWLFAVDGGDDAIAEGETFMAGVTVYVEGSTTYLWVLEHERVLDEPSKWQTFYGDRKTFVFSSRPDLTLVPGADIEVLNGPVEQHIDTILAAAGDGDVLLAGGGALAAAFAEIGRLDAIYLSIAPVTLGAGAPLLPARFDSTRLRLTAVHQTGQFIQAEYEVLSD
ncbi:dihydrofolate reductase [Nocardioides baekrokdamisoli]|uniref:Dihydrofolate reductase n=1 Tax=Nocardioides baekrokdamisoli TaxID=1804624 RepID=A0A3G9IM60_9ACTN|nr:dihydrofolate reductase family protein [Nocardioides baekrokdamisoli]BBH17095.1 dihydrofolate reductase [Nocardioides baekrokdamisoli]